MQILGLDGSQLQLLVLGDHYLLEGQEVVAKQHLLENLEVPLICDALHDALLQQLLGNARLLGDGLQEQGTELYEPLVDVGVLELVDLGVLEVEAVLLNEIEKGVAPDGGDEVLLDEIVGPHVLLGD